MKQQRKIDDHVLLQMIEEGKTQDDCAAFFQCSQPAIAKRLKRLTPAPPSKLDELTPQQAAFSQRVASGMHPTSAALEVYDCNSRDSAKQIGKKLMLLDDVRASIEELMNDCGLTRGYRVRKLKQHIEHPDAGLSLKALTESFKIAGDYAPQQIETFSTFDIRMLISSLPDNASN